MRISPKECIIVNVRVDDTKGSLMSLRIKRLGIRLEATQSDSTKSYVDRLVRLLPAEIVAAYTVIKSLASSWEPAQLSWLGLVCLLLAIALRAFATTEPGKGPQWIAVAVSAVSFVLYLYTEGGQLPGIDPSTLPPNAAQIAMVLWVTVVPQIYRGD